MLPASGHHACFEAAVLAAGHVASGFKSGCVGV